MRMGCSMANPSGASDFGELTTGISLRAECAQGF